MGSVTEIRGKYLTTWGQLRLVANTSNRSNANAFLSSIQMRCILWLMNWSVNFLITVFELVPATEQALIFSHIVEDGINLAFFPVIKL